MPTVTRCDDDSDGTCNLTEPSDKPKKLAETYQGLYKGSLNKWYWDELYDAVNTEVTRTEVLWGLIPLIAYWISRVWLLAHRGQMDDDPVLFATRDPMSYAVAALAGVVLAFGTLLPPP